VEVSEHIETLEREGRRLVAEARSLELTAPVPSCPDWRVSDLLAHLGFVHRWATSHVTNRGHDRVDKPDEPSLLSSAPPNKELCQWVEDGHGALVRALRDAPSDLYCWTFLAAPSPLAMWARRQAHETAVHRVDVELAGGATSSSLDPVFATDGIDELLFAFLSRSASRSDQPPVGRLGLDAVDRPETWTVEVLERGVHAVSGLVDCDLVVRGPAVDLYLLVWNRRSANGLELVGHTELLDDWSDRFQVKWT
jgi:uncharacterized protein (TIGR03083 family)